MGEQKKQMESLRSKQLRAEAETQSKAESEQNKAAIQPLINETVDEIKKMGAAVKTVLEEGVEIAKDTLGQIRDGNETDRRILTRTEEGNQQRRDMTTVMAEGSRETGFFNRFSKRAMIWTIVIAALALIVALLSVPFLQPRIERFVAWGQRIPSQHVEKSPTVNNVVGNVYISYSELSQHADKTKQSSQNVVFVTEDIKSDQKSRPPTDQYLKGEPAVVCLDIRFTIYNNTDSNINVYDLKTIEYSRYLMPFPRYGPPPDVQPRIGLEISADKPLIEQDKTFIIKENSKVSIRLRYNMTITGGTGEIVFGILAYYNTPNGSTGKVKSDKVYRFQPLVGYVAPIDSAASYLSDLSRRCIEQHEKL